MNRRQFLFSAASAGSFGLAQSSVLAQGTLWPRNVKLEHGDVVFMKRKSLPLIGRRVSPLNNDRRIAFESIAKQVSQSERSRGSAKWSPLMRMQMAPVGKKGGGKLDNIIGSYDDYVTVGHVAIVKKTRRRIEMIEATGVVEREVGSGSNKKTVRYKNEEIGRTELKDWLEDCRVDDQFWVGKFLQFSPSNIDQIVRIAESFVGKSEYDLSNRNLADTSSFFCSKLIWYAVHKALGYSLDNDPEPDRFWPFSPKLMIKSPYIKLTEGRLEDYR